MITPFVTVLIDTYNHERFIEQAILSVLEQDIEPRDMEIIVVDDGSTDSTPDIVRKFVPCVRYIRKTNGGQASAFNVGIPLAKGEIIAFLDGDDWWARNKLRTVLEVFDRETDIGAVGHGYIGVHRDGHRSRVVPDECYRLHLRSIEGANLFRRLKCFLGTSKVTIRKAVLNRVLPIPETLTVEADEFMFTLSVAVAGAIVIDQPLFFYRFHTGNLFQFQSPDLSKQQRKLNVLLSLMHTLPPRLAALDVSPDVIDVVIHDIWIQSEQLRLSLFGGWPWETFRVEKAAIRHAYRSMTPGYRLFKMLILASTLVLPPRLFYRLKRWYSEKNLARWRECLGAAMKASPIVEQIVEDLEPSWNREV